MTYEEAYRRCKTPEEFREEVKRDIMFAKIATMYPEDNLKAIQTAANLIVTEKGWETAGGTKYASR